MGDTLKDLTGMRFGRWQVLERSANRGKAIMWLCRCDCGNISVIHGTSLKSGTSTQCKQCRDTHRPIRKHGLTHTPLYRVWCRMKGCTSNPRHQDYTWYGAKGIRVCTEWSNDFVKFYDWAISNGYEKGLTIDRIDVLGNYEPSNCRWITIQEQSRNRTDNVKLTHNGVTHTLVEWGELTGIKMSTLSARYHKGWSSDKILSTDSFARGGGKIGVTV